MNDFMMILLFGVNFQICHCQDTTHFMQIENTTVTLQRLVYEQKTLLNIVQQQQTRIDIQDQQHSILQQKLEMQALEIEELKMAGM